MHFTLIRCKSFNMQLEIRKLLYNLLNTGSQTLINDPLSSNLAFDIMLKISVKSLAPVYTSFFKREKKKLINTDNLQYLGYAWMIEAINKYWYVGSEFLI